MNLPIVVVLEDVDQYTIYRSPTIKGVVVIDTTLVFLAIPDLDTSTSFFGVYDGHGAAIATEASAKVIDGKSTAKQIRDEIAIEISRMKESTGIVPGLTVILVGDKKDSETYVCEKKKG